MEQPRVNSISFPTSTSSHGHTSYLRGHRERIAPANASGQSCWICSMQWGGMGREVFREAVGPHNLRALGPSETYGPLMQGQSPPGHSRLAMPRARVEKLPIWENRTKYGNAPIAKLPPAVTDRKASPRCDVEPGPFRQPFGLPPPPTLVGK